MDKHKITIQVYTFLLDVVTLGYSVNYLHHVARRHARPDKLITEAYNWGLIDNETMNNWKNEIL